MLGKVGSARDHRHWLIATSAAVTWWAGKWPYGVHHGADLAVPAGGLDLARLTQITKRVPLGHLGLVLGIVAAPLWR
jgi:hypothetical protein